MAGSGPLMQAIAAAPALAEFRARKGAFLKSWKLLGVCLPVPAQAGFPRAQPGHRRRRPRQRALAKGALTSQEGSSTQKASGCPDSPGTPKPPEADPGGHLSGPSGHLSGPSGHFRDQEGDPGSLTGDRRRQSAWTNLRSISSGTAASANRNKQPVRVGPGGEAGFKRERRERRKEG